MVIVRSKNKWCTMKLLIYTRLAFWTPNCPPIPWNSPQFICQAWHFMVWNRPLVNLGHLFWLCSPSGFLDPQWQRMRQEKKSLTQEKHILAKPKISMCYQHHLHFESKPQPYKLLTRNYLCPSWNQDKLLGQFFSTGNVNVLYPR